MGHVPKTLNSRFGFSFRVFGNNHNEFITPLVAKRGYKRSLESDVMSGQFLVSPYLVMQKTNYDSNYLRGHYQVNQVTQYKMYSSFCF